MAECIELLVLFGLPFLGGALAARLWLTRPPRRRWVGLAVGEVPGRLRRRAQAVRREVSA
ncbi:MAG: hypothetical protein KatS3mg127_1228 [Silanimonas sp.]|nr:MAG: hypothetical protein KatS3mg127_1228 [Silanimonas sp.]